VLFAEIGRIGAGDPVCGPLPADPKRLEGQANRLATDLVWGQPLRDTDLRGHGQCPPTGRVATGARALVQPGAQACPPPRVDDGLRPVGPGGLGLEGTHPPWLEGVHGMADRLVVTAPDARDRGRGLTLGTGQHHLTATDGQGLGRSHACCEGKPLVRREQSHNEWCVPVTQSTTCPTTLLERALGEPCCANVIWFDLALMLRRYALSTENAPINPDALSGEIAGCFR